MALNQGRRTPPARFALRLIQGLAYGPLFAFAFALALLFPLGHAQAGEIRVLQPGHWSQLLAEHRGQALLVAFWSASCAHCPTELKALAEIKRQRPATRILLIATDTPHDIPQLTQLATHYGLADAPQWVFANVPPEQLRFEIDRKWYGELPRTLFIDAEGNATGRSGVQPKAVLRHWAKYGTLPRPQAESPSRQHHQH